MWSCNTWFVNTQFILHIVFQLYDVLMFDSRPCYSYQSIHQYIIPKVNNQILLNFEA